MSAKLIYFLKANPVLADPLSEPIVPFAYAENVRRVAGKLRAENVQTATPTWSDGQLHLRSQRLPDSTFCGFAYRMPMPGWFIPGLASHPS